MYIYIYIYIYIYHVLPCTSRTSENSCFESSALTRALAAPAARSAGGAPREGQHDGLVVVLVVVVVVVAVVVLVVVIVVVRSEVFTFNELIAQFSVFIFIHSLAQFCVYSVSVSI